MSNRRNSRNRAGPNLAAAQATAPKQKLFEVIPITEFVCRVRLIDPVVVARLAHCDAVRAETPEDTRIAVNLALSAEGLREMTRGEITDFIASRPGYDVMRAPPNSALAVRDEALTAH